MKNIFVFISKKINPVLSFCLLIGIISWTNYAIAQVSVTATSGTSGPTTYSTVNAAFTAINAGTHQGAIVISITSSTFEPTTPVQLVSSGTGSAVYQSVKIQPVGNDTINSAASPTTARAILEFIGADSVTIDGDDPSTAGTQNLTIMVAATANASTACIRFSSSSTTSNGCLYCTVKNCNIIGGRNSSTSTTISYGIFCGLSTAAATITTASGSADNDSLLIQNNNIMRCYYGIYCYGLATYYMDYLRILNNTIGSSVASNSIGFRGMLVAFTQPASTVGNNSVLIEGNDIQGGDPVNGLGTNIAGIDIATTNGGAVIRKNNIHDWFNPSTGGWGVYGIMISNVTNNGYIDIYNNMIRNIQAFHYTSSFSTYTNYGIYCNVAVPNLKIHHNTIALLNPNAGSGTSNFSACIALGSATLTLAEFSHNILINKVSDNTGQACVGLYLGSANEAITASIFDRNDYFVTGPSGYVGRITTTNYGTLTNWKTITTKDTNSFNVDPAFTSATNLHLLTSSKSPLESGGVISSVMTDIDGDVRPGPTGSIYGGGTAPDIGADEADLRVDSIGVDSIIVDQITGQVAPGTSNQQIFRIKTYLSGTNGSISLNSLALNTAGSTSASDISAAHIYYTGTNATFSTTTTFGSSISSPSGAFAPAGTQSLSVGVNYFWLTYDVSSSATATHVLDARLDSMQISANYYFPVNGNPTGNVLINPPMTYLGSDAIHPSLSKIEPGSTDNKMLRVMVRTSSTGSPINLTQLDFSTNGGGVDTLNIASAKVYYTGSNSTFSNSTQFGSTYTVASPTSASWGPFSITGSQVLNNDTNYFWLVYDLKAGAVIGDSVDAEISSVTIASVSHTPTTIAPLGNRYIRAQYCASSATTTADEEIWNVTFGGLNNTSNCSSLAPGPGSSVEEYSNYTTLTATNILRGTTIPFSILGASCGGSYTSIMGMYIDWNSDGDFADAGELVYSSSAGASVVAGQYFTGNVLVPCNATLGETRMRVTYQESSSLLANGCGTFGYGETEDYTLNILDNPLAYNYSGAIQQTGVVAPGAYDRQILRIPLRVNGCGLAVVTQMVFNTAGSTSASDITIAKLYRTGNSPTFTTTNLVSTIASPSGQFVFMVSDTVLMNDTTNYWLAYDVSSSATLTHVLDARIDSIQVLGSYHIPSVTNPGGNVTINAPMTYIGSDAIHPSMTKVAQGTADNQMLRILVRTSSTGSAINLTQISMSTNGGGIDTLNIATAKIYYTGKSSVFANTNQFGSTYSVTSPTTASWGAFSITGSQILNNDTNYFWLVYNLKASAVVGDSVDAEISSVTIASAGHTPTTTAPAGNRIIRADYCLPTYSSGCGTDYIARVRLKNLDNSSGCATGSYTYFSNLTVPNLTRGMTDTITLNYGSDPNQFARAWIDFNGDGDFNDIGEDLGIQSPANAGASGQAIIIFSTPCNASLGDLRLRIRGGDDSQPTTAQSCGNAVSGYGEGEDYIINILNNPPLYVSSTAIQQTGTVGPGTSDKAILRIPIRSSGCGILLANSFNFNTTGSTSASDITAAKLYVTGNIPTFNTSRLLGSVSTPNGIFTISVSDTLVNNDTTNYWLAYDISSGATLTHVVDARLDSVQILGTYRIPTVGNPTGNVLINSPMTYLGSDAVHPDLTSAAQGSNDIQMLRIIVRTSSTGSPANLTQLDFSSAGGGIDTSNIASAKVYYTGNNSIFANSTQFGSTYTVTSPTSASWGTFAITGSQALNNDTNYFWLVYNLKSTAIIGDSIDAIVSSITVASVSHTPTTTAPVGNRKIRAPYCTPAYSTGTGASDVITNVTFAGINNSTGASSAPYLTYYSSLTANVTAGTTSNLSMTVLPAGGDEYVGMWIDFNDDGIFSASERLINNIQTSSYTLNQNLTFPLNANPGAHRMRIRISYNTTNGNFDPCASYTYGETEDYNINVLPAPTPAVYVWNQTSSASFTVASNWTPARNVLNLNDKLLFNGGTNITVTNVPDQIVSNISVSNNTIVNFNAASSVSLVSTDSLALISGRIVTSANVTLTLGTDTINIGTLTGTGGMYGIFKRWINNNVSTYTFPMMVDTNNRNATIIFTSALTSSGTLTSRFVTGIPGNSGLPLSENGVSINKTCESGVWQLTAGNGLTGGTYTSVITAQRIAGVSSYTGLVLLERTNNSSSWTINGTAVYPSGSNSSPILSRTGMTGFGEFGVGGDSTINPLPVSLLHLSAKNIDGDVLLNWTTSSEINNKGFEVQRSLNGINFDDVTFVIGTGNTSSINKYLAKDPNAFKLNHTDRLFYRLKQVDFNGKYMFSEVVQVDAPKNILNSIFSYPNPFDKNLTIEINSESNGTGDIKISDIRGVEILSKQVAISKGNNKIDLGDFENISNGIYFVRVLIGGEYKALKITKIQ